MAAVFMLSTNVYLTLVVFAVVIPMMVCVFVLRGKLRKRFPSHRAKISNRTAFLVESIMGEDDTFLETFEEDMKYSDTPIASSVAECLADIFQDLFNFVSLVKESEGEQTQEALAECKENFESYWAQTLCNVMRALNHIRYSSN